MTLNNRNVGVDYLKAISIFGVVYIHGACTFVKANFLTNTLSDFFRFCVPVFIIFWVYFLEKSILKKENEQRTLLISRFKHLFMVFILWSSMYFLLLVDWNTLTLSSVITKHFSGYGWSGQYFFIILFQLILFYPLIRWTYNYIAIRTLIVLLVVLITAIYSYQPEIIPEFTIKLGDRPFLFWMIYVYVGISLARNEFKKISVCYVLTILLIPVELYLFESPSPYLRLSILFSTILACSYIIQQKNLILNTSKVGTIISHIGQNTMIIFLSNPIIIILFNQFIPYELLHNEHNYLYSLIISLITSIVIIVISLLIEKILKRIKMHTYLT